MITPNEDALLSRVDGPVLMLTLNRSQQRSALTAAMLDQRSSHLRSASRDATDRAIVLTGAGKMAFCAGADLASGKSFAFDDAQTRLPMADFMRLAPETDIPSSLDESTARAWRGHGVFGRLRPRRGGRSRFVGLARSHGGDYPMQVLALLQHRVARRYLIEMCFTGAPICAVKALDIGLVSRVVPKDEMDIAVQTLLAHLMECSPTALRRGKYATDVIESMSFEASMRFMEGQIGLLAATQDATEGLLAFREKRKPGALGDKSTA